VAAALDPQRLEVLKGPQGLLYEENSTGGAVNYVAAKPTDYFTAGAKGSYGRFNTGDLEAFVSGRSPTRCKDGWPCEPFRAAIGNTATPARTRLARTT
jgi:hypothetical protein